MYKELNHCSGCIFETENKIEIHYDCFIDYLKSLKEDGARWN